MAYRILLKGATANAYNTAKTACQGGTLWGVTVSLKAFHDNTRRLLVECADRDACRILLSELGERAADYPRNDIVHGQFTDYASMFEEDSWIFSNAMAFQAGL